MKKIIIGVVALAAMAAVLVGCKTVPTADKMYTASYAIGSSAGFVANMTKIDDTSRNVIVDIMNKVQYSIPETNQTFTAAWTPIAEAHVAELVKQGKIDAGQAVLITGAFKVAVNGIDYLFNVRYPTARQYQELVESAVHGFCTGFLNVFKPVNVMSATPDTTYDADAYNYLMSLKYNK